MKKWTLIIGLGLALVPLHNREVTELATLNGRVLFFLPTFGFLLLVLGAVFFMMRYWKEVNEAGFGDKKIWIPLAIIVVAMGVSGFVNGETFKSMVSPLFMGCALFCVYLVARIIGPDVFKYLIPFVIIGSVSVIVLGLVFPGQYTGGFITNYCASAGFLIFGVMVYRGKWKLALLLLAAVGLFFIGALEVVFIVGVIGICVLVRRDWNIKLLYGVLLFVGLGIIWFGLGHLTPLYEGNQNLEVLREIITGKTPLNYQTFSDLTTGRWVAIVEAARNFSFIGHGYSLSTVPGGIVHNIPLIIMHQIGPFAALAWLFVTMRCLIKTNWKYIWVAVIAMCVFDHYLWTQTAPWWWALVGVTTSHNIKNDWIFKCVSA